MIALLRRSLVAWLPFAVAITGLAGLVSTNSRREDRVTWQPRDGVRMAAVVVAYSGGTVVAGRSLREVESRADDALAVTGLAWLTCLVLTLAACAAVDVFRRRGYG